MTARALDMTTRLREKRLRDSRTRVDGFELEFMAWRDETEHTDPAAWRARARYHRQFLDRLDFAHLLELRADYCESGLFCGLRGNTFHVAQEGWEE